MLDQYRDVVQSFPQRRHRQTEDSDSVVEILSEPPIGHLGPDVTIRRGDDANVESSRWVPPTRSTSPS